MNSIIIAPGSTSSVTANPSFNGLTDTNLIASGSSLAVGASVTVSFDAIVRPTGIASSFSNSAQAQGSSPSGATVADDSVNGTDPNPTPTTPPSDDSSTTLTGFTTLSGHVFSDTNGDGVQQSTEPNLNGQSVMIAPLNGTPFMIITDANGDYVALVPPGSVTVDVSDPSGGSLTTANDPQTVIAANDPIAATAVGFQPRGTVSGVVFTDTNGDGIQQSGEPGAAAVQVVVTDSLGVTQTVTTDQNGRYTAVVPAGRTTVNVIAPAGTKITTANNPQTLTVLAGDTVTANPTGLQTNLPSRLSGRVFDDTNGNGQLEPAEPGIPGAKVELFEVKPDGTLDFTKPILGTDGKPLTAITDKDGNYTFPSVPPGPVAVRVTDPAGKVLTTNNNPQNVTVQPSIQNNAAPVGYVTPKITLTLTPGVTVVTPGDNLPYTAVVVNNTPGAITPLKDPVLTVTLPKGVVFNPTKPVTVGGVPVPAGNVSVKPDPTDPTRQILVFQLPNELKNNEPQTINFDTIITPGVDPTKPLIAVGVATGKATNGATTVSVSSGAVAAAAVKINLGVFSNETFILGRVYFDKNDNNNFDAGDQPLPGARVYLSDGRYAVTDANGLYNISNVAPGIYAVRLDPVTAPYTPKRVPDDGGTPGTRFVNANQGGGISFEDFPLETPLAVAVKSRSTVVQRGPVTLEKAITQGGAGYAVTYTITVTKAVGNLAITDPLPANAERGPVTGATLEGNVLRFAGITQPGTYTVTFALFSTVPPDLILTDPEIVYQEIFTLIPRSPSNATSSGGSVNGSINSQEVKR